MYISDLSESVALEWACLIRVGLLEKEKKLCYVAHAFIHRRNFYVQYMLTRWGGGGGALPIMVLTNEEALPERGTSLEVHKRVAISRVEV